MRQRTFLRFCIGIPAMLLTGAVLADGSGQWQSGQEAYNKVCGFCHERGVGPTIKGLGGKGLGGEHTPNTPEKVRQMVRFGNRAMPAFRQTEIDDATLTKIAEYIQ